MEPEDAGPQEASQLESSRLLEDNAGRARLNALFTHIADPDRREFESKVLTELFKRRESGITCQGLFNFLDLFVRDDWLDEDEVPGNIYRMWSWSVIGINTACRNMEEGKRKMTTASPVTVKGFTITVIKENLVNVGTFLIWVVQVVGPPLVFLSYFGVLPGAEVPRDDKLDWRRARNHPLFQDLSKENALTKLFSAIFIFLFSVHAMFFVLKDWDDFAKLWQIKELLQVRDTMHIAVYIGCFTNCWCAMWLCLDAWIVLAYAGSPKDVLYDALGLLFLFNLDDIGGDLAFTADDDWPNTRLGWLHKKITDWEIDPAYPDEEPLLVEVERKAEVEVEKLDDGDCCCNMSPIANSCYVSSAFIISVLLVVLPVTFLAVPFKAMEV